MSGEWNRIDKANELMSAAAVQGIRLDEQEATIILGYLEGHDYCLVVDTQGRTLRHDTQDGDDHREDKAYTIQDAIIFCWEMNEGILNNCESRGNLGEGYLTQLERDREILSEIMVQCL